MTNATTPHPPCAPPYAAFEPNCGAAATSYCAIVANTITSSDEQWSTILFIAVRVAQAFIATLIALLLLKRAAHFIWLQRGRAIRSGNWYSSKKCLRCYCCCCGKVRSSAAWLPSVLHVIFSRDGGAVQLLAYIVGFVVCTMTIFDAIDPAGWCGTLGEWYTFSGSLLTLDIATAFCFTLLQLVLHGFFSAMSATGGGVGRYPCSSAAIRGNAASSSFALDGFHNVEQPVFSSRRQQLPFWPRCDRGNGGSSTKPLWCGLDGNFWLAQVVIYLFFVGNSAVAYTTSVVLAYIVTAVIKPVVMIAIVSSSLLYLLTVGCTIVRALKIMRAELRRTFNEGASRLAVNSSNSSSSSSLVSSSHSMKNDDDRRRSRQRSEMGRREVALSRQICRLYFVLSVCFFIVLTALSYYVYDIFKTANLFGKWRHGHCTQIFCDMLPDPLVAGTSNATNTTGRSGSSGSGSFDANSLIGTFVVITGYTVLRLVCAASAILFFSPLRSVGARDNAAASAAARAAAATLTTSADGGDGGGGGGGGGGISDLSDYHAYEDGWRDSDPSFLPRSSKQTASSFSASLPAKRSQQPSVVDIYFDVRHSELSGLGLGSSTQRKSAGTASWSGASFQTAESREGEEETEEGSEFLAPLRRPALEERRQKLAPL